ncbi:hypothetical protein BKA62DRAFT_703829 [Auriculariales sp. MPI-PUGE-AT-0066]|nr:hypothetical protein BKA62DRAFT_703829 [Auriculariales sp. MPI-PUGE-AT-0066]
MPSFLGGFTRSRARSESGSGAGASSDGQGQAVRLYVTSDSEEEPPATAAGTGTGTSSATPSMSSRKTGSQKPMDRHAISSYYNRRSMTEDDQAYYNSFENDFQTPTQAHTLVSSPPPMSNTLSSPPSRPTPLSPIPSYGSNASTTNLSGAQQVKERYMTHKSSTPNLNGGKPTPLGQRRPSMQLNGDAYDDGDGPPLPPVPPLPDSRQPSSPKLYPPDVRKEKGRSPWRKPSKGPDGGIAGALAATGVAIAHPRQSSTLLASPPVVRRTTSSTSVRSSMEKDREPNGTPSSADGRGRHLVVQAYAPRSTSDDTSTSESETDDASRLFLDQDAIPVTGFAVASSKRNIEFHEMFPQVPPDDYLIEDYGCALQREILVQGRIYISENHLCFHANIFGWVSNEVIPFVDVIGIEKKMTALIIPNAIQVSTPQKAYTFASFMGRDTAYDVMHNIWRLARPVAAEADLANIMDDSSSALDLATGGAAAGVVRKSTTCQCGDNKEHYNVVCMDTVFPGEPDKIYNLLFASGFIKTFLIEEQKLTDLQISDWAPTTPGSTLLTRNMSYIKPLNASIGPRSARCELKDETIHFDPDRYITMMTTTRTPEVPSGSSFSVKSRTCLTWAGACHTRVVVTSAVEWTGSSFIKGIITSSAMDGQKRYNLDLEPVVRKYIEAHKTEFVPEGVPDEPEPDVVESPTTVRDGGSGGGSGAGGPQHDERWLQWALDTFRGASKVAQQSFTGAVELLMDVPFDTRAILLFVIFLLVVTNVFSLFSLRGGKPKDLAHVGDGKKDEAGERRSEVSDTLRSILEEMRRVAPSPPASQQHTVLSPADPAFDWRSETADIGRALDALEERVLRLRQAIRDDVKKDEL